MMQWLNILSNSFALIIYCFLKVDTLYLSAANLDLSFSGVLLCKLTLSRAIFLNDSRVEEDGKGDGNNLVT